jgi:hypothetical protein
MSGNNGAGASSYQMMTAALGLLTATHARSQGHVDAK